jgi:hypothetical protein
MSSLQVLLAVSGSTGYVCFGITEPMIAGHQPLVTLW